MKTTNYNQNIEAMQLTSDFDQVFKKFKEVFRSGMSKSIIYSFEEALDKALSYMPFLEEFTETSASTINCWYDKIIYLRPFIVYLSDTLISEVIIHSNTSITIEKNTGIEDVSVSDLTETDLDIMLEYIVHKNNALLNFSNPFSSFYTKILDSDFRLTITHPAISALQRPKLFFRRISSSNFSISKYNLSDISEKFLKKIVKDKRNIIVSGETGSGKTTLLKALLSECDNNEHIVILEDTYELKTSLKFSTNLISSNDKGKSLKDFCKYSLRMAPSRIIIGEMRSAEIVPFVLSMNTGHSGLMSTIHASSAKDTIMRMSILFSMYSENQNISLEQITLLLTQNIDYIIYMKDKKITECIQVLGSEGVVPYFENVTIS